MKEAKAAVIYGFVEKHHNRVFEYIKELHYKRSTNSSIIPVTSMFYKESQKYDIDIENLGDMLIFSIDKFSLAVVKQTRVRTLYRSRLRDTEFCDAQIKNFFKEIGAAESFLETLDPQWHLITYEEERE